MPWRRKWTKSNIAAIDADGRNAEQTMTIVGSNWSKNHSMKILSKTETDRVIQMAWEDRRTFDAIYVQFDCEAVLSLWPANAVE